MNIQIENASVLDDAGVLTGFASGEVRIEPLSPFEVQAVVASPVIGVEVPLDVMLSHEGGLEPVAYNVTPPEGTILPPGLYDIAAVATDRVGRTASKALQLQVVAPLIVDAPDVTAYTADPSTVVAFGATVTGGLNPKIIYSHASDYAFPEGQTAVTVTAIDDVGQRVQDVIFVTVIRIVVIPPSDARSFAKRVMADPRAQFCYPMWSHEQVAALPTNNQAANEIPVYYDAEVDGLAQVIDPTAFMPDGVTSMAGEPEQVWLPIRIPGNVSFLLVDIDMWSPNWRSLRAPTQEEKDGGYAYIWAEKSRRFDLVANPETGLWLMPKHMFGAEGAGPYEEKIPLGGTATDPLYTFRICGAGAWLLPGAERISEHIGPIVGSYRGFEQRKVKHCYYWGDNQLSVWSVDKEQGVVQRLDRLPYRRPYDLRQFRLEDDISQPGNKALNGRSYHWTFFVGALVGITLDEARAWIETTESL